MSLKRKTSTANAVVDSETNTFDNFVQKTLYYANTLHYTFHNIFQ